MDPTDDQQASDMLAAQKPTPKKHYKVLDQDFKADGIQFVIGQTSHALEGNPGLRSSMTPFDAWSFQALVTAESQLARFVEVTPQGETTFNDGSYLTASLTVDAELTLPEIIERGIDALIVECDTKTAKSRSADMSHSVSGDGIQIYDTSDSAQIVSGSNGAQYKVDDDWARISANSDLLQITSTGDAAKIGANGSKIEISSSGDWVQIGTSGDRVQIDSNGDAAKIATSGDRARIGAGGDGAQVCGSGDWAQIGASGNEVRIGISGDRAQIGASGDFVQISASGDSNKMGASGSRSQLSSSGDLAQIAACGDWVQIGSCGDAAKIGASGDRTRISASGDMAKIVCQGSHAVVASAGKNTVVSGIAGTWISLASYDSDGVCTGFATGRIGEGGLRANTAYGAFDGQFVDVVGI